MWPMFDFARPNSRLHPTVPRPRNISECVSSLLNGSQPKFEAIRVEDASCRARRARKRAPPPKTLSQVPPPPSTAHIPTCLNYQHEPEPSDHPHPRQTLHNTPVAHPALVPPRPDLPPSRPGFSASRCRPQCVGTHHVRAAAFQKLMVARRNFLRGLGGREGRSRCVAGGVYKEERVGGVSISTFEPPTSRSRSALVTGKRWFSFILRSADVFSSD